MSETLVINSTISHYRILKKIGEGGMGEVYLAEDTRLRRRVALKVLPENISSDKDRLLRFEREAFAASALNHPNILTIFEFGAENGAHFLATEYVEGETLREKLQRKRLTIEEAFDIAVQTASALSAAHASGIVHRDIKPENIMLRRDRLVKVLDFGLAKLAEGGKSAIDTEAQTRAQVKTEPGVVMGTVNYMSPEQARGKETDARSDIWSLGCVLYEMISGQTPFAGETTADRIASIIHKEPLPLSHLAENVPTRLEEIVSKCLEKDRDERYQTIKDLLIDLRRLKRKLDFDSEMERSHAPQDSEKSDTQSENQTQIISAAQTDTAQMLHTTSSAEYIATEIKQHKKGFTLALVALCLAIVAGAFLWYKFSSQNKPTEPTGKMRMTRLVSGLSGRPGGVSISPDGKYVAYGLWEAGKASLWVKQISQDTSLQILPPVEGAWFAGTTFSPDGEIVYFVGGHRETNTLGSLYQIPVLGGKEPKKILDHVSSPVSLSPDGKQFAFIRGYPETGETAVMIANTDGSGEARKIGSRTGVTSWFEQVAWSPDGKTIACSSSNVEGGFAVTIDEIPIEGGAEKAVSDYKWGGQIGRLLWVKDGSGLIVAAIEKPGSPPQLWFASYPDGKTSRITNDLNEYGNSVGITADASTIVTVLGEWSSKIWSAAPNEDEAQAKRISNGKEDGRRGLALMPEGRIVYVTSVNGVPNLAIMNPDGTQSKILTNDTFAASSPVVSRDGRFIVFASTRPDNLSHIWRIDADGGNLKQLTTAEDYSPDISPDGRWVVFNSFRASGKPTLWKVPIEGGEALRITETDFYNPKFSPDGKLLLSIRFDETLKPPRDRASIISFENGQIVQPIDLPTTATRPMWSVDGREIIYIDTRSDVGNIWSQPVSGGTPKQLTKFTSDFIDRFDVSRDGKRFVMSRTSGNNDVVLIKDFR